MSGSAGQAWETDSDSDDGIRTPRRCSRSALMANLTRPSRSNSSAAPRPTTPPTSSPRKRKRILPFPHVASPSSSSSRSTLPVNHSTTAIDRETSDSPYFQMANAADTDFNVARNLIGGEQLEEDPSHQDWLRKVMEATIGPCVALVYEIHDTPTGTPYQRYTPLHASWLRNWSQELEEDDLVDDYPGAWSATSLSRSQARTLLQPEKQRFYSKQKHLATAGKESELGVSELTANSARSVPVLQANKKEDNKPKLNTENIPLEILENIIRFLSRNDVKNMRLVDRAFERGVSAQMFGTVVVPFNTEIYGLLATSLEPSGTIRIADWKGKGRADATTFEPRNGRLGKALDIFRGFGPHIRRYGMSFEVQEQELASPPNKSDRQDHAAYWGKYTWPYPQYRRFADRADLEVTADETSTMKRAFSHLEKVQHLALTLDCGLGWLNGADVSLRGCVLRHDSEIFGESNYSTHADVIAQRHLWTTLEESYDAVDALEEMKFAELVRVDHPGCTALVKSIQPQAFHPLPKDFLKQVHCAPVLTDKRRGLSPKTDDFNGKGRLYLDEELDLDEEMMSLDHFVRLTNFSPSLEQYNYIRSRRIRRSLSSSFVGRYRNSQASPNRSHNEEAVSSPYQLRVGADSIEASSAHAEKVDDEIVKLGSHKDRQSVEAIPNHGVLLTRRFKTGSLSGSHSDRGPKVNSLNPGNLTKSQKEWLLESKWAQDAFLSSYMLAITDNHKTFGNVQSLTLSRFSSRHLPKLVRQDFWEALPSLSSLNLEIIADWRDVEKDQTGYAADSFIDPSIAASNAYSLLKKRVSLKKSIKSLSFGWVDGGEHAEGLRARNKHILPAPICQMSSALLPASSFMDLLVFPTLECLKLTNCWLTPNALRCFVSTHGSQQLKKLTLDSVSITTHPRFNRQNGNNVGLGQAFAPLNIPQNFNAFAAQNFAAMPQQGITLANGQVIWPNTQAQNQQQQLLIQQQLQQMQQHMQQLLQLQQPPPNQNPAGIREGSWADVLDRIREDYQQAGNTDIDLTFLSCGYVRMRGTNFDQSVLETAALEQEADDLVATRPLGAFLSERLESLGCTEMVSRDALLASIVTALPAGEMETLRSSWGMRAGWPTAVELGPAYDDEDGWGRWGWRSQQAAEYDGARAGGTGRFSGKVVGFAELDDEEA